MRKLRRALVFIIIASFFLILFFLASQLSTNEPVFDPLSVVSDKLCVLVPYRDRWKELQQLVPHLERFLNAQGVAHVFIVLNQTDSNRFNRASLINVGWLEADRLRCNYMVMHDVDLLPLNPELNYHFPGAGIVRHIASGRYHPKKRYDYPKFIGGILMLTMADFKRVNGMSNKYWGWGLEDDEFYLRLRDAHLLENIDRPQNLTTDRESTFLHVHDDKARKRDRKYILNQKQMAHRRDFVSGLSTVKYRIVDRNLINISGAPASIIDIELYCDKEWTPYCTFD